MSREPPINLSKQHGPFVVCEWCTKIVKANEAEAYDSTIGVEWICNDCHYGLGGDDLGITHD